MTTNKRFKRVLALLLAAALCFSNMLSPALSAFAATVSSSSYVITSDKEISTAGTYYVAQGVELELNAKSSGLNVKGWSVFGNTSSFEDTNKLNSNNTNDEVEIEVRNNATAGDTITVTVTYTNGTTKTWVFIVLASSYTVKFVNGDNTTTLTASSNSYKISNSNNIPTVNDSNFLGWSEDPNATEENGTFYSKNDIKDFIFVSNTTYYAIYKTQTYTVTYNANGGSVTPASVVVDEGTNVTLPTLTRDGYTFDGWQISGSDTIYTSYTVNSDVTFIAKWTQLFYTVTFYDEDGTTTLGGQSSVTYGTKLEVPTSPTKADTLAYDYEFKGWATSKDSTTTVTLPSTITANATYYAVYTATAVKYNVSYADGLAVDSTETVDNMPYNETVANGTTYTIPTTVPQRTGYTFLGWDSSVDGTDGEKDYDRDDPFQMPTQAVTLTAVWEINTYTVSYDANGGTGTTTETSGVYDTDVTVAENNFTNTHYTFTGWNTDATGTGTAYAAGATIENIAANVTLYAQWQAKTYTVTYEDGDVTLDDNSPAVPGEEKVTYAPSKTITVSDVVLTSTNKEFLGWSIEGGDGTVYTARQTISLTGDITLVAVWKNYYTVSYSTGLGDDVAVSGMLDSVYDAVVKGTEMSFISSTTPTAEGYIFEGWVVINNTTGDKVDTTSRTQKGETITEFDMPASNVTITATWTKLYTVTYALEVENDNVTLTQPEGYYAEEERFKIVYPNDLTLEGYEDFDWAVTVTYTDESGKPVSVDVNYHNQDGAWYPATNGKANAFEMPAADVTVTFREVWSNPTPYSISYYGMDDANYADGASNPATYTIKSDTITLANPSKTGYNFTGWVDENNKSVTEITTGSTGKVELTATWEAITYTVTYKVFNVTYATETYTIESPNFDVIAMDDTGYTFSGWYSDAGMTGDAVTEIENGSIGDITLYGAWNVDPSEWLYVSVNSYTGTYDGEAHGVSVVAVDGNGTVVSLDGATIQYASSAIGALFGNYSDEAVTRTDVGLSTVYVQVELDGYVVVDAFAIGTITVKQKSLTVTATSTSEGLTAAGTDYTMTYGTATPDFTAEADGFVGEETYNFTTSNDFDITDSLVNVGSYDITVDSASRTAKVLWNYDITYVGATLTVEAAELDLEIGEDSDEADAYTAAGYVGVYDATAHDAVLPADLMPSVEGVTYTYSMDGEIWSDEMPTITNVGEYTIYVTADAGSNYTTAMTTVSASITPATLTITVADLSKTAGETDPTPTATVDGLMPTDGMIYSISRVMGESVGTYAITAFGATMTDAAGDDATANYDVIYLDGTLTINAATTTTTTTSSSSSSTTVTEVVIEPEVAEEAPVVATTPAEPEVEEPAEEAPVEIEETEVPLAAEQDTNVEIEEEEVPLVATASTVGWALLNLILVIGTVATSIVMLVSYFLNRRDDEGEQDSNLETMKLFSILPAAIASVFFLITSDMSSAMAFVDKWTLAVALIALVQLAIVIVSGKGKNIVEGNDYV